ALPSPLTQTRPSIPPLPTTPFNDVVLTSSSVDFNAVQKANTALNNMLEFGNSIMTPVNKYISCLTRTVVCLHTANTIIQHENEDIKAVTHGRKYQLNDKRRVINDKYIITAAELLGVQEAEKVIKA